MFQVLTTVLHMLTNLTLMSCYKLGSVILFSLQKVKLTPRNLPRTTRPGGLGSFPGSLTVPSSET